MQFFRKYFVVLALVLVGIAAVAYIAPMLMGKAETLTSNQIKTAEIDFTHEGDLSIFKGDKLLKKIAIEFANSPSERELGLMYRQTMQQNQGMLFVFPDEQIRTFYMKNTFLPLDIIYINANKEIISIVKNARPMDETSLPSEKPAKYVLEINAGLTDAWGIEIGDHISY